MLRDQGWRDTRTFVKNAIYFNQNNYIRWLTDHPWCTVVLVKRRCAALPTLKVFFQPECLLADLLSPGRVVQGRCSTCPIFELCRNHINQSPWVLVHRVSFSSDVGRFVPSLIS